MKINGWGHYPTINSEVRSSADFSKIQEIISKNTELIPNGLFRSYGDSALADITFSSLKLNKFLKFDLEKGILHTEAGVSFQEINEITIPKGWFLPVTPGTKFVTVGGAIASDVHGKNHHKSGTFGKFVMWIKILTADANIVTCSRNENEDLFRTTIGGMGLTGIILEAEFHLQKIGTSAIEQKTLKARNLDELLVFFEEYKEYTYSVSWLDTAVKGAKSGRGLLFLGEHSLDESLGKNYGHQKQLINLPVFLPNFALNAVVLKTFNFGMYTKEFKSEKDFRTDFDTFFYPLDAINNWNRMYGKRGFAQYQFVIPMENAALNLKKVLKKIADYGLASFLTVLKVFGEENDFYLSFPQKGYTLAMDFAISRKSLEMFIELDKIIADAGGRLYLTKDSRMSQEFFKLGYPNLEKFLEIKHKWDPLNKFQSVQSKRLGI